MNQRRYALVPLFLIIFIDSMGYGLIIPVLLRLLGEAGTSAVNDPKLANILFGLGVAIGPLAYFIAAPIVGAWSDQWGRRKALLVCLSGSCLGFLLPIAGVYLNSLSLIFLGRFLAGACSSSQPIAQAAVIDVSENDRSKAFYLAMIALAMTIAMVAGPLLGGYLADSTLVSWFNNATPFYVAGILTLLNIVLLLAYFRETNPYATAQAALSIRKTVAALTQIVTEPRVRFLWLAFFLYEFAWSLYFQDISLFLVHSVHASVEQISVFIAYAGLWMSFGLLVLYPFVIRYLPLRKCLFFCLAVCVLALLSCGFLSGRLVQWIFVVPLAVGVGMAYPTFLALLSRRISAQRQGWVMGAASAALALSWTLSSVATGFLTNIALALPLQIAMLTMLMSVGVLLLKTERTFERIYATSKTSKI